ncbi:MAG: hypothetical protein WC335_04040 [Candidatus Omnitrophota bacterium]
MKKMYGLIFVVIFLFAPVVVSAEDITITTYYPSPYGSYDQLQTANNTYLATGGGFVGIGNTTAGEKLDVTGNIRATGTITGNNVVAVNEFIGPGVIRQIRHAAGTTNIDTTSTTYQNMAEMDISLTTLNNSILFILWNASIANEDFGIVGNKAVLRVTVDGVQAGTFQSGAYTWNGTGIFITQESMGGNCMMQVNAGVHRVRLQWLSHKGERIYSWPTHWEGYGRSMTVMEIVQPGF